MFEVYSDYAKNFKDRYYLVTPLTEVAYTSMCDIQFESPFKCLYRLPKCWCHSHFLGEVGLYLYLIEDLFKKETYMKRKPVAFWESLGFVYGVGPFGALSKKQKKWAHRDALCNISNTIVYRTTIF